MFEIYYKYESGRIAKDFAQFKDWKWAFRHATDFMILHNKRVNRTEDTDLIMWHNIKRLK